MVIKHKGHIDRKILKTPIRLIWGWKEVVWADFCGKYDSKINAHRIERRIEGNSNV